MNLSATPSTWPPVSPSGAISYRRATLEDATALTVLESLRHVAFADITLRTPSGKPAEPLAGL